VKSFDVRGLALSQGGEYVLGMKDLHSDACYLIYGILQAAETDRPIKAGKGYEEILCAVDGPLLMRTSRGDATLAQGHAVHVDEEDSFTISNPSDRPVVYVLAGGRRRPPFEPPLSATTRYPEAS
jgi:hypothetical protein